MADLIPTLLAMVAVACFVYALVSRRRQLEARALLAEASVRYESVQKLGLQHQQQLKSLQEQFDRLRAQNQQQEKALEESKQKLADRTLEWSKVKAERDEFVQRSALQKEHLNEQVGVLTAQLAEAVREKKLASDEAVKHAKDSEEKTQKQLEALRVQLRETQQALQTAKRDYQQLKSQTEKAREQASQVKPEELRRYRLKVLRLEQLYTSMKGLREMAEERNKNWETALRYFADHILERPLQADLQSPLGPLVGAALEKIGARLVEDEGETLGATAEDARVSQTASDEEDPELGTNTGSLGADTLQPVQL